MFNLIYANSKSLKIPNYIDSKINKKNVNLNGCLGGFNTNHGHT